MQRKAKIAVVSGNKALGSFPQMFDLLSSDFEFTIFAFDDSLNNSCYKPSCPVNIFENDADMPGYMKTLEDRIQSFDAVIAFETSQLSSFQAIRAALKFEIPSAVLCFEHIPFFYAEYENIRAIQTDILTNADKFWATSGLCEKSLFLEKVAPDKIAKIKPAVELSSPTNRDANRKRFRDYIGIPESCRLIVIESQLEDSRGPTEVLLAIKKLQGELSHNLPDFKVLFVGDGSSAKTIKYRAHDLGVARNVLFLHQDTANFRNDLMAASDIALAMDDCSNESHNPFPWGLIEMVANGAIPCVLTGSIAEELFEATSVELKSMTADYIAESLNYALRIGEDSRPQSESQHSLANLDINRNISVLRKLTTELLEQRRQAPSLNQELSSELAVLDKHLKLKQFAMAEVRVEDLLLRKITVPKHQSELHRIKGDLLRHKGDMDEAVANYGKSLEFNQSNHKSLCGLGHIAMQGHANREAMNFYRKALAKKEDEPEALRGVGMIKARLGQYEESVFFFERCLTISTRDRQALSALVQACIEWHETPKAIEVLEGLQESGIKDNALVGALGKLYLKEGMTEKGQELINSMLTSS